MTETLNPPLTAYSTQQARADELHRRKLRRELLAQWRGLRGELDTEKLNAVRNVNRTEFDAARNEVDNAA